MLGLQVQKSVWLSRLGPFRVKGSLGPERLGRGVRTLPFPNPTTKSIQPACIYIILGSGYVLGFYVGNNGRENGKYTNH